MKEQAPVFHETVARELADVIDKAPTGYAPFVGEGKNSIQTADINGRRLTIDTDHHGIFEEGRTIEDRSSVEVADTSIDELNDYPEVHAGTGRPAPGADVDLGLRNPRARMRQTAEPGSEKLSSLAEVKVPQGTYTSKESNDNMYSVTGTYVERPGYGSVEIKNPKARALVAKLSARAIKKTQEDIQSVKGKEEINEREWVKKTRRATRKVIGKEVQKTA